jgi:phosphatidylglycerophosphate synthase
MKTSSSPDPYTTTSRLSSLPNQITTLRLILIGPLWVLAILQRPVAVGILLAIAASTDALDGYVARRRGQESDFGTRYDSFTDHLLAASTVAWLLLLRPDFLRAEWPLLVPWLALGGLSLVIGWLRFGRIGGFHLYSAKAANALGFGFVVYLLIFETYPPWLFYIAIGAGYLGAAETLLVQLTRSEVDTRIGTILRGRGGGPPL